MTDLTSGDIVVLGRMVNASNGTLLAAIDGERVIYKPTSGERPLWDFPENTLALRERAAFVASELLGWNIVPETILREGPEGFGSVQRWVDAEVIAVDLAPDSEIADGWLHIASGQDETGRLVTLAHSPDDDLLKICVFDAVINNADRKGGHILTDKSGKHWAIDHGVTFNAEPKLRTVLWGWIGDEIDESIMSDLVRFRSAIFDSELAQLLNDDEVASLVQRVDELIATKVLPEPNPHWPAVPWPVF